MNIHICIKLNNIYSKKSNNKAIKVNIGNQTKKDNIKYFKYIK